jgi:hypothetical protein
MQLRATLSSSELKEAALIARPTRFWLRFFAANWYSTGICLAILCMAIHGVVTHQQLEWRNMVLAFCAFAAIIWFRWNRWNARVAKIADTESARSGVLILDNDGIRTTLQTGTSNFVPWSSYKQWKEGKRVFLLTGKEGDAIIPIDDGFRDSIRILLTSKIR